MHLHKTIALFSLLACVTIHSMAQPCTALGQTPSSAFPVCGTNTFKQTIVPYCGGTLIPGACSADGITDQNPFWYKFTCFTTGTLGFQITPDDLNDDYDWQLFDVTGRSPNDVFIKASLFVASNWSGRTGITGASAAGIALKNCSGNTPLFSSMPTIQQGHNYLLLLSHFTNFVQSDKGYELSFGGGTANITDTTTPAMLSVETSCDGYQLKVKLNKLMKCSSLDADGSDFKVPGPIRVLSASGVNCNSNFEMDSLELQLSAAIQPGHHVLIIKKGKDKNTLQDNCDNEIALNDSIPFETFERHPTPLDSLFPVECRVKHLEFAFNKNIKCSSIDGGGTDFTITGSYPVDVESAVGRCLNGVTKVIKIGLRKRLETKGTFTINLQKGIDGNTLIDECDAETPLPAFIQFYVKDTVSAAFNYKLMENCTNDQINLFHNGANDITAWNWRIDNSLLSVEQNPALTFTKYGTKNIQLTVTNDFCTDSIAQDIVFPHDSITAAFSGPSFYCPNEFAIFTNASTGNIVEWNWQFGNGNSSSLQVPPAQSFFINEQEKNFSITLTVKNNKDCYDTAAHLLKVVKNCRVAVPNAFTPNGDGTNDYLYPLNAYKVTSLHFVIYNKLGQILYETKEWTKKWNGTVNGQLQPPGVYVWMLQFKDENGKMIFLKGTSVLIR